MLAKRIIPTILNKNGHLVKGRGFACDRVVGNAMQAARVYAMRGVDELMILYVGEPDYRSIKQLSSKCFAPVTVGGGIKTAEHVRELLNNGADKVCIGSSTDIIPELSERFGRQCITVSLERREHNSIEDMKISAKQAAEAGAGEILLHSVDRDGTMEGYDLELIEAVSESVSIPVVASGGCSGYEDMFNAIKAGASAVAAGALFQFTDSRPKSAAEYLHNHGVEVRLC